MAVAAAATMTPSSKHQPGITGLIEKQHGAVSVAFVLTVDAQQAAVASALAVATVNHDK